MSNAENVALFFCDERVVVDGVLPNGDKAHFAWRGHVNAALAVLKAIRGKAP